MIFFWLLMLYQCISLNAQGIVIYIYGIEFQNRSECIISVLSGSLPTRYGIMLIVDTHERYSDLSAPVMRPFLIKFDIAHCVLILWLLHKWEYACGKGKTKNRAMIFHHNKNFIRNHCVFLSFIRNYDSFRGSPVKRKRLKSTVWQVIIFDVRNIRDVFCKIFPSEEKC